MHPSQLGIHTKPLEVRRHPAAHRLLARRCRDGAPRRGEHLLVEQRPPADRRRPRQQPRQLPGRGHHMSLVAGRPAGRDCSEHPPCDLAAEHEIRPPRPGRRRPQQPEELPSQRGRLAALLHDELAVPPLFTPGAPLDYRMLGFQFWLADQFTAVGLEGASALFAKPDAASRELVASTPPTDDDIRRALVDHAAHFGVLTTFVVQGSRPHLELARLYRAQRGHPLRLLERWRFTADNDHLPTMAPRFGLELQPSTWQQLFDTHDPVVAGNFFTALGCHASCDQGFAVDQPDVALHAALTAVAAGMRPAIDLLPALVSSLRTSGSAGRDLLRAAVDDAARLVVAAAPSRQPMLAEYGLTRSGLPN